MPSSRSTTLGFAERTLKNMEYVKHIFHRNGPGKVHMVTQVMNSLLGLVIVPNQWGFDDKLKRLRLKKELRAKGLPEWNIILDKPKSGNPKTDTLEVLIWHLRNAAAHGRFEFLDNPDSPKLEEVRVVVKDKPFGAQEINWQAEIRGDHLYEFCRKLAELIVQANN